MKKHAQTHTFFNKVDIFRTQ